MQYVCGCTHTVALAIRELWAGHSLCLCCWSRWVRGRKVSRGRGTAPPGRGGIYLGSEQLVSWSELSVRACRVGHAGAIALQAALGICPYPSLWVQRVRAEMLLTVLCQPVWEMCHFNHPAGKMMNLEKWLSFCSAEPSTLSSFSMKLSYLT